MKKLQLLYIGRDNWSRPVYEANGHLYVDTEPRKGYGPHICTKLNDDFCGEPDTPISDDIEIEFIPCRDIWE